MTVNRQGLRIAALATAWVVAACAGGGPTTAPTHAMPIEPPTETFDLSTFDLSSFDLGSFAIPSFAGDDELEALLPDTIGGTAVIKQSFAGQDFISRGIGGAAALKDLLGEMGASNDSLSVAIGSAGTLVLIAYRVEGLSAERVFDGLEDAFLASGGGTISETIVGGRNVSQVTSPGETTYIYLADEVLVIIGGNVTPALLEETVTQLPAP
jgi:hypothetical protein